MSAAPEPAETLLSLNSSLDQLESSLLPLLSTPLQTLLDNADPLQQAKLQTMVAYVVHDLIWISLKTSGVDPNGHPVIQELARLQGYFEKVKQAEGSQDDVVVVASISTATSTSEPRPRIDKAAANRFITAAIKSGRTSRAGTNSDVEPSATHKRFEGVDELLLSGNESSDEESEEDEEGVEVLRKAEEALKKAKANEGGAKSKRPYVDPFAGYDSPKVDGDGKNKKKKDKGESGKGDESGKKVKKLKMKK